MVFFKLEQYPKAIRIFKQLVKTNPNFPTLYMNLGLAYLKQGDYEAAEQEFQRVVQMDPGHINAHNYLGLVYSHINRFEDARNEFEKANSPNMVAKMDEKIRMARPGVENTEPGPQESSFEEIKFEQPPEAYSTFSEPEGSEVAQPPQDTEGYASQEESPPSQNNVTLTPPEGVIEEQPPPPQEVAPEKEIIVHKHTVWSLKELTRSLAISKDNVPDLHLRNEKLMQIVLKGGQVFARLGGMVASEGELSYSTAFKRFKGKETKAIFGGKDDPIMRISGEGQLLLSSQDHVLGFLTSKMR
jgi:hypothetical protein